MIFFSTILSCSQALGSDLNALRVTFKCPLRIQVFKTVFGS